MFLGRGCSASETSKNSSAWQMSTAAMARSRCCFAACNSSRLPQMPFAAAPSFLIPTALSQHDRRSFLAFRLAPVSVASCQLLTSCRPSQNAPHAGASPVSLTNLNACTLKVPPFRCGGEKVRRFRIRYLDAIEVNHRSQACGREFVALGI